MAAGLGTRLRPFTDLEPKALLPVMGVPCAQFAVDAARAAGVERLVANIHHHAPRAQEGLERLDRGKAELILSDESELLLGSAGGLSKALLHFDHQPFFLLNADVLCDVDLAELDRCHQRLRARHGVTMTLTVFERPEGNGAYREIHMDPELGLIRGFGEVTPGKPYFVGVAVLEPEAIEGISSSEPSEFLPKILEPAIRSKKAGFFLSRGKWFDIGNAELWGNTHFHLMRLLETGDISSGWRRRIEAVNCRVGQERWVSRRARRGFPMDQWHSQVYFHELGDSTAQPPKNFGPRAIVYGQSKGASVERQIVYRGASAQIE